LAGALLFDEKSRRIRGIFVFSGSARTLNSFQIPVFKIKNKNKKSTTVDVLFKAYPMVSVPLSCRSNLAGRYL
jgi:hypothetical protein